MQSPAEELFEAVQERNGLLSRAVDVISTLQIDVAGLLWELDEEEGLATASLCSSKAPSPAATVAQPAGLANHGPAGGTADAKTTEGELYGAVLQRNNLLHRVVDTIERLQVDAHGLLWEIDKLGSTQPSLGTEEPLYSPIPFPTLSPDLPASLNAQHSTTTYTAAAAPDGVHPESAAMLVGHTGAGLLVSDDMAAQRDIAMQQEPTIRPPVTAVPAGAKPPLTAAVAAVASASVPLVGAVAGAGSAAAAAAAGGQTSANSETAAAGAWADMEACLAAAASKGGASAGPTISSIAEDSSSIASRPELAQAGLAPVPVSPPAAMALISKAEASTAAASPLLQTVDLVVADTILDGAALSPHTAAFVSRAFAAREAQAAQDAVDMDLRSAAYGQAAGAEAAKMQTVRRQLEHELRSVASREASTTPAYLHQNLQAAFAAVASVAPMASIGPAASIGQAGTIGPASSQAGLGEQLARGSHFADTNLLAALGGGEASPGAQEQQHQQLLHSELVSQLSTLRAEASLGEASREQTQGLQAQLPKGQAADVATTPIAPSLDFRAHQSPEQAGLPLALAGGGRSGPGGVVALDSEQAVGVGAYPASTGIFSAPALAQRKAAAAANTVSGGIANSGGGGSISGAPHCSGVPAQTGSFLARVLKAAQSFQPDPHTDAQPGAQHTADVPPAAPGAESSLGSNSVEGGNGDHGRLTAQTGVPPPDMPGTDSWEQQVQEILVRVPGATVIGPTAQEALAAMPAVTKSPKIAAAERVGLGSGHVPHQSSVDTAGSSPAEQRQASSSAPIISAEDIHATLQSVAAQLSSSAEAEAHAPMLDHITGPGTDFSRQVPGSPSVQARKGAPEALRDAMLGGELAAPTASGPSSSQPAGFGASSQAEFSRLAANSTGIVLHPEQGASIQAGLSPEVTPPSAPTLGSGVTPRVSSSAETVASGRFTAQVTAWPANTVPPTAPQALLERQTQAPVHGEEAGQEVMRVSRNADVALPGLVPPSASTPSSSPGAASGGAGRGGQVAVTADGTALPPDLKGQFVEQEVDVVLVAQHDRETAAAGVTMSASLQLVASKLHGSTKEETEAGPVGHTTAPATVLRELDLLLERAHVSNTVAATSIAEPAMPVASSRPLVQAAQVTAAAIAVGQQREPLLARNPGIEPSQASTSDVAAIANAVSPEQPAQGIDAILLELESRLKTISAGYEQRGAQQQEPGGVAEPANAGGESSEGWENTAVAAHQAMPMPTMPVLASSSSYEAQLSSLPAMPNDLEAAAPAVQQLPPSFAAAAVKPPTDLSKASASSEKVPGPPLAPLVPGPTASAAAVNGEPGRPLTSSSGQLAAPAVLQATEVAQRLLEWVLQAQHEEAGAAQAAAMEARAAAQRVEGRVRDLEQAGQWVQAAGLAVEADRLHTDARKAQKAADESRRQHNLLQQDVEQLQGHLEPKEAGEAAQCSVPSAQHAVKLLQMALMWAGSPTDFATSLSSLPGVASPLHQLQPASPPDLLVPAAGSVASLEGTVPPKFSLAVPAGAGECACPEGHQGELQADAAQLLRQLTSACSSPPSRAQAARRLGSDDSAAPQLGSSCNTHAAAATAIFQPPQGQQVDLHTPGAIYSDTPGALPSAAAQQPFVSDLTTHANSTHEVEQQPPSLGAELPRSGHPHTSSVSAPGSSSNSMPGNAGQRPHERSAASKVAAPALGAVQSATEAEAAVATTRVAAPPLESSAAAPEPKPAEPAMGSPSAEADCRPAVPLAAAVSGGSDSPDGSGGRGLGEDSDRGEDLASGSDGGSGSKRRGNKLWRRAQRARAAAVLIAGKRGKALERAQEADQEAERMQGMGWVDAAEAARQVAEKWRSRAAKAARTCRRAVSQAAQWEAEAAAVEPGSSSVQVPAQQEDVTVAKAAAAAAAAAAHPVTVMAVQAVLRNHSGGDQGADSGRVTAGASCDSRNTAAAARESSHGLGQGSLESQQAVSSQGYQQGASGCIAGSCETFAEQQVPSEQPAAVHSAEASLAHQSPFAACQEPLGGESPPLTRRGLRPDGVGGHAYELSQQEQLQHLQVDCVDGSTQQADRGTVSLPQLQEGLRVEPPGCGDALPQAAAAAEAAQARCFTFHASSLHEASSCTETAPLQTAPLSSAASLQAPPVARPDSRSDVEGTSPAGPAAKQCEPVATPFSLPSGTGQAIAAGADGGGTAALVAAASGSSPAGSPASVAPAPPLGSLHRTRSPQWQPGLQLEFLEDSVASMSSVGDGPGSPAEAVPAGQNAAEEAAVASVLPAGGAATRLAGQVADTGQAKAVAMPAGPSMPATAAAERIGGVGAEISSATAGATAAAAPEVSSTGSKGTSADRSPQAAVPPLTTAAIGALDSRANTGATASAAPVAVGAPDATGRKPAEGQEAAAASPTSFAGGALLDLGAEVGNRATIAQAAAPMHLAGAEPTTAAEYGPNIADVPVALAVPALVTGPAVTAETYRRAGRGEVAATASGMHEILSDAHLAGAEDRDEGTNVGNGCAALVAPQQAKWLASEQQVTVGGSMIGAHLQAACSSLPEVNSSCLMRPQGPLEDGALPGAGEEHAARQPSSCIARTHTANRNLQGVPQSSPAALPATGLAQSQPSAALLAQEAASQGMEPSHSGSPVLGLDPPAAAAQQYGVTPVDNPLFEPFSLTGGGSWGQAGPGVGAAPADQHVMVTAAVAAVAPVWLGGTAADSSGPGGPWQQPSLADRPDLQRAFQESLQARAACAAACTQRGSRHTLQPCMSQGGSSVGSGCPSWDMSGSCAGQGSGRFSSLLQQHQRSPSRLQGSNRACVRVSPGQSATPNANWVQGPHPNPAPYFLRPGQSLAVNGAASVPPLFLQQHQEHEQGPPLASSRPSDLRWPPGRINCISEASPTKPVAAPAGQQPAVLRPRQPNPHRAAGSSLPLVDKPGCPRSCLTTPPPLQQGLQLHGVDSSWLATGTAAVDITGPPRQGVQDYPMTAAAEPRQARVPQAAAVLPLSSPLRPLPPVPSLEGPMQAIDSLQAQLERLEHQLSRSSKRALQHSFAAAAGSNSRRSLGDRSTDGGGTTWLHGFSEPQAKSSISTSWLSGFG